MIANIRPEVLPRQSALDLLKTSSSVVPGFIGTTKLPASVKPLLAKKSSATLRGTAAGYDPLRMPESTQFRTVPALRQDSVTISNTAQPPGRMTRTISRQYQMVDMNGAPLNTLCACTRSALPSGVPDRQYPSVCCSTVLYLATR